MFLISLPPPSLPPCTHVRPTGYLSGFTHFSYVLPDGLVNKCGWVGLAELPGTQTWYTPDSDVSMQLALLAC